MGIFDRILGGGHGGAHHDRYRTDPPRTQDNAWGTSAGSPPPAAVAPTIACATCGAANGSTARFCQQCGTSLAPAKCAGCGAEMAVGMKFCGKCGKER
ncbi:MAG: zinc ribbon domain-containing protein [Candidimonas sp.]|nr:MAG: zinc ribbon domain-containing protein [Candidimonas sp.]TAM25054.1 MAG: zinc ribbon domain-containing protein [Candidimonas sp.]